MKTKGCPNCGKYHFVIDFKFCPWCRIKLEEKEKTEFEKINIEYTKRIYGFAVE